MVVKDYLLMGENRFVVLKDYLLGGRRCLRALKDFRPTPCLARLGRRENTDPMPNYETAFFDSGVFYDTPGTGNQPKQGSHMAGIPVPTGENDLLAFGEDMAEAVTIRGGHWPPA